MQQKQWNEEAEEFFQTKKNMNELHEWLRNKNVFYTFEKNGIIDNNWSVILDSVRVNSIACESWLIMLSITLNNKREIETHNVEKHGNCL